MSFSGDQALGLQVFEMVSITLGSAFVALRALLCYPNCILVCSNVIDADTLREAQQHPDEYRNLLVRVTSYNAYFTGLGKEIQDEIIAREAHQL